MTRVARFDLGGIAKTERDGETLRCFFRFRKVGPLTYRHADGTEHTEYVLDENLFSRNSLRSAAMKPITQHHPDEGMVSKKTARKYQRGLSGNTILRDDPYAVIVGAVTDEELQDAILSRELDQISSGYWAKTVLDAQQRYVQTDVEYNHFAATNRGRAGPDVGFLGISNDAVKAMVDCAYQRLSRQDEHELFNKPLIWTPDKVFSLDSDPEPIGKTMTTQVLKTIKIDDTRTVQVGDSPDAQALGSILADVVTERNAFKVKADGATALQTKVTDLERQLATATTRADLAEKKPTNPDGDTLKKTFDEGYASGKARYELEQTALKLLPATVKVDSKMSDRQIKESCVFQLLGIKADSPKAKTYSDMSDEGLSAAYQTVIDSRGTGTNPRTTNTNNNQPPDNTNNQNLDAADMAYQNYVEKLKAGKKKDKETAKC